MKHLTLTILTILTFTWMLAGCSGAADDTEQAHQTLVQFFEQLSQGHYAEAAETYGGSYEMLVAMNPELDPDTAEALLQNGCKVNGLQCLPVRTATFKELTAEGEYVFTVQFSNPDGSLFERGACCGEETITPPIDEFPYRVVKGGDGQYRVLDLPVYVP